MGLIDVFTSLPVTPADRYNLDHFWHYEVLECITENFDPKDTQKADLTMAWIQALIGAIKIMYKKVRTPSELNDAALEYLFS
jgi:hypothetical protein